MKNVVRNWIVGGLSALMFLSLIACSGGAKKTSQKEEAPQTLSVFAAASLTDVLSELADSFQTAYHVKVATNMASSGTLARQIEQGGAPDIYLSASKKWADYVDSLGKIVAPYRMNLVKNDLVLIVPKASSLPEVTINENTDLLAMLGNGRLSMGDPSHVPAGRYAKQALEHYGWYAKLEPHMLPAKDVRSALMVVEMGEAPLGIVYRTDAQKSTRVRVIGTFPDTSHKPIVYVAAVIKDSPVAENFYRFLNADANKAIWHKYGFNK